MFLGFLVGDGHGGGPSLDGLAFDAAVFDGTTEPLGVLLAARSSSSSGCVDDLREVSPPAKVAGMVLAGSVLVLFGVTMLYFRIPFYDYVVLSPDLAPLVTVLWVVLMANAINLIDGLDGLAAGIVAIAAGSFFLYSEQLSDLDLLREPNIGPLMAIIAVGLCVGFLPHNFNPARIFMGDGGALLLGLLMAASTIAVGGRRLRAVQRPDVLLLRPAVHPARHPRGADRRHGVLDRAARPAARQSSSPTRTTCTTG